MKIAIYPGSFDPITNGHLDIIKRSLKLFDKIIVLVSFNPAKKYKFDTETKINMIKESLIEEGISEDKVSVDSFSGLTVDYAKTHRAACLIRGLRVVSDFEYEWSLNAANNYIDPSIEMVFLMAKKETSFISSSTIKTNLENIVTTDSASGSFSANFQTPMIVEFNLTETNKSQYIIANVFYKTVGDDVYERSEFLVDMWKRKGVFSDNGKE